MRAWIRSISVLCAVGIVLFLGLEAMLRMFWPELFPHHIPGLYAPHPELGHVLAPNRETLIVKPEYTVTNRTNSDGFRGSELAPKTSSTLRIVCLGDWLTWGEGVEENQSYPVLLEKALRRRRPELDIQVINAGIPQYGTLDELAYFESFASDLELDAVIVQFYAGDDFEQNRLPSRERHEFRGDTLEQLESFSSSTGPAWLITLNWLKHRSHFVHWASEQIGSLVMRADLMADLERASSTYFSDAEARRAQELLAEIEAVAEGVGAETLFVFAPEKMQVMARPEAPLRAAGVVAAVAAETGAGFVDLTSPLLAHEDMRSLYLTTVGTWRPPAYRIAADAVEREIIALGWLDLPRAESR